MLFALWVWYVFWEGHTLYVVGWFPDDDISPERSLLGIAFKACFTWPTSCIDQLIYFVLTIPDGPNPHVDSWMYYIGPYETIPNEDVSIFTKLTVVLTQKCGYLVNYSILPEWNHYLVDNLAETLAKVWLVCWPCFTRRLGNLVPTVCFNWDFDSNSGIIESLICQKHGSFMVLAIIRENVIRSITWVLDKNLSISYLLWSPLCCKNLQKQIHANS